MSLATARLKSRNAACGRLSEAFRRPRPSSGAAALGDIGRHFPDTDPAFKDADSLALLKTAADRVRAAGFEPINVDATVIAQAPKIAPYVADMAANLARAIGLPISRVNVKGTTEEGLGFTGRGEGIAAMASALVLGTGGEAGESTP